MGIKVLLLDDEDLVRRALREVLVGAPGIAAVEEAASVGEGIEKLSEAPDVAVLVIGTVDDTAIDAVRSLSAASKNGGTQLLALANHRSDRLTELIDAGSDGLVLKCATPGELVCAVSMTAAGYAVLAPQVGNGIRELLSGAIPSSEDAEALEELSAREREVLELLAHGKTNAEIAAALVVTTATVKSHIQRIFDKLALRDRTQAVIFAYESGVASRRASDPAEPESREPVRKHRPQPHWPDVARRPR